MGVEIINEEKLAGELRANYQRIETENYKLRQLLLQLMIVNGPQELPVDLPPSFTNGWGLQIKRVRKKMVLSAVMKQGKAVA